jgi:hypothetical protein
MSDTIKDKIMEDKPKSISLELGDIIEIHSSKNTDLHSQSFFINYIDGSRIDLTNIITYVPYQLKLDENGNLSDVGIEQIALVSRSDESGYARQHLLLPKTWIDLHFNGEIPLIITGEITNLEEDQIEITTFPDFNVIYIDFEYKGLPDNIPLGQIVIRTKPASLNKIGSLLDIRDQMEEGEVFDPEMYANVNDTETAIEYNDVGEALITLPENVQPDVSVRDELRNLYSEANEIIFGEDLGEVTENVELSEKQMRHGIDTQVNDLLDVLLSGIPTDRRNKNSLDNIHLLIERFRELRNKFSKFDANGNVYNIKSVGSQHKPLARHIEQLDRKLKWVIPVSTIKRKIYSNNVLPIMEDTTQMEFGETILEEKSVQTDYLENRLRGGDRSAYVKYHEKVYSAQQPFTTPTNTDTYLHQNTPIHTDIETIVDNLDKSHSSVLKTGEIDMYEQRQYVIQRYNLGESHLDSTITSDTGKKVYIRESMTPNDSVTMKSVMVLPKSAMQFSNIDLPSTSLLTKTNLSQNYMYLFRLFTKHIEVITRVVDDFNKDMDKTFWTDAILDGSFEKTIQEFVLDDKLEQSPERFTKFLNRMIPDTTTLVNLLTSYHPNDSLPKFLSMKRAIQALEPFLIYEDDLNYTQYNAIRFFVKTQSKEYKLKLERMKDDMRRLNEAQYIGSTPLPPQMELILSEKKNLLDVVIELYKIHTDTKNNSDWVSSSEWLSKISKTDNSGLFYTILRMHMISLITPENLSDALKPDEKRAKESDDMSQIEKIKPTDCARRVLTKQYSSMSELQKDNNKNDIFYDDKFDDTPYEIKKLYKEEEKKYSNEDFIEFLRESLVQKHDCPPKMALEMAMNIIDGKKRIQEGEYALLEVRPQLPSTIDESTLTTKERRDNLLESEMLKKTIYYKRMGEQWVHAEGMDETAFVNSNELFCNMSKICFRDSKKNVCDSIQGAENRMREITRKKIINEFDERFAISVETLEEELNNLMLESVRKIKNITRLNHVQQYKANDVAFELGKFAKDNSNIIRSPHLSKLDKIKGQTDFVKTQNDIIDFSEHYCRNAMVKELGENQYWLYCVDTNTQLLPTSLFELAKAFISTDNYLQKQSELCRKQGVLSDDGDSIVDKYSGEVLRKIDFVSEQGYDENGFKIVTSDILETDEDSVIVAIIESRKNKKDRVFENDDSEKVYGILRSISNHIGIPSENIEEFVLRTSLEIITRDIKNEQQYNEENVKLENDKKKRLPPYKIYRDKRIILIVTSLILVSIQTVIPSFKIQKTFPGCVQSFSGFPDNQGSIGDTSGLLYLACILNIIKTKSSAPWNSIKPLPMEVIKSQLEQTISSSILTRNDITDLYVKKREYLILNPDQHIPLEHSIEKWVHFQPPTIEFNVLKNLRGIPSDYKNELIEMMKTGNKKQRNQLSMYMTKSTLFGMAVIENINRIIRNKGLLLKTASKAFFTENACCNDKRTANTMEYFENENNEITVHIKMVRGWEKIINDAKRYSKATILYHPNRTGLVYNMDIPSEHFEKNVYIAFIHYCNLDTNIPIPENMRPLFPDKLPEYNPKSSISDKMEFLKRNGKRLTNSDLMLLMDIVNKQNITPININKSKGTRISQLQDFLQYLDAKSNSANNCKEDPFCDKFRELLSGVLNTYNPSSMTVEDNDETYKLNNWLSHANSNLLVRIVNYMSEHGRLSPENQTKIEEQLSDIHMWNMDTTYVQELNKKDESAMYTVTQFMRESVFSMSRVYPEIILNNHEPSNKSHKHWGFAGPHHVDITNFLSDYYKPFKKFKNDKTLSALLTEVQNNLNDLSRFLVLIPAFTPIHRDAEGDLPARSYYSLFTKRTLYMIYSYIWYSVLYEYIIATDNEDLIQLDIVNSKNERREIIKNKKDKFRLNNSVEYGSTEDQNEYSNNLSEMLIISGDKKELKTRVSELIMMFIDINMKNKKTLDLRYSDIEKRVTRSRMKEKKMITDFLRDMDPDERRVEDTKKILKLGRWNIGLRKGLVKYDQSRYVEERKELFNQLSNRNINSHFNTEDENDIPIQLNVDELEARDNAETDEFHENEANNFDSYQGIDAEGEEDEDEDDY